jgi:hypothetical protein
MRFAGRPRFLHLAILAVLAMAVFGDAVSHWNEVDSPACHTCDGHGSEGSADCATHDHAPAIIEGVFHFMVCTVSTSIEQSPFSSPLKRPAPVERPPRIS